MRYLAQASLEPWTFSSTIDVIARSLESLKALVRGVDLNGLYGVLREGHPGRHEAVARGLAGLGAVGYGDVVVPGAAHHHVTAGEVVRLGEQLALLLREVVTGTADISGTDSQDGIRALNCKFN